MLANQRQDKIYEMLQNNGAVHVSELVKRFEVSIETIRKDLLLMEQKGRLQRVHGGAVKTGEMKSFGKLTQRNMENVESKRELAIKAIAFIAEGDIVAIDSGSTAMIFAETLREQFHSLTVVTHSKDVFDILCDCKEFEVILCAGHYLKDEKAFYGDLVIQTLKQLHVQKAFIFTSAISLQHGIFDFNKHLCQIQREMLHFADKVYFLADSSKFEKTGLIKLCDVREEYTYVTDENLTDELKKMYINNGFNIIC